MRYTPEQRRQVSDAAAGRIIKTMYWEPPNGPGPNDGAYWVIEFDGGDEMCVRLASGADASASQARRVGIIAEGKVIEWMGWAAESERWIIRFTDGSHLAVHLMAELAS